ncbi:MAG: aminotransferase class V-fold PLP-dependent enzyme [Suipraeoptans sp.]
MREEKLLNALTDKTKVLAVSQVHYSTGTKLSLTKIGKICRERNILFFVDGTQAFGATPTDLTYVDFYTASTYKWLLSGFGLSLLVAKSDAQKKLTPAYIGHNGRILQYSHINYPAVWVLESAISYFDQVG